MNRTRRFLPALESLESIVALSTLPGAGAAAHPLIAQHSHPLALRGEISGIWGSSFGDPPIPDGGAHQTLSGSGRLRGLGKVELNGSLHTPGFITTGTTTGSFDLTNARGTIHLEVAGAPQPGFTPPPSSLTYTITGGTGRYAHVTGHGTVDLSEVTGGVMAGAPSFRVDFHPSR
jgi:hypothetical protein